MSDDSRAGAESPAPTAGGEPAPPEISYGALFVRFLGFGFMAWGGPVAQIAMVRRELVEEDRWISSAHFNRLLAVMQVLPGPEAHELCVHLGMRAKGRVGGILAGLGFMLPGFLLMLALSWAYFALDIDGTALGAVFLGVQAAVIALIVRAVHRIGAHVLRDAALWIIAIVCGLAAYLGTPFWITLPAAGLVYALLKLRRPVAAALVAIVALAGALILMLGTPAAGPGAVEAIAGDGDVALLVLFASGLKAGLLTFGGAYTAIPFIRNDAVGRGWMTDGQFLDGLALSGVLPAPLIIFATFVGYVGGGPIGAVVMTAGVFLPAFGFTLVLYDRLEAVLEDRRLHALLEGVAAAVVGLIAATTVDLALATSERISPLVIGLGIFAASLAVLYVWTSRLNIVAVIAAAGVAGAILL